MNEEFRGRDMSGTVFDNANLGKATFYNVNLSDATIRFANLSNLSIEEADVSGMTVFGIDVGALIEAEPGDDWAARFTAEIWEPSTMPVEETGVRRVVPRTGVVFSTEGGALPRLLLPFRLFAGGPMGSGEQWYSWIHLRSSTCPPLPDRNRGGAWSL